MTAPAAGTPGYLEAKQWLECIINDSEPVVKPEQALVVTQILEAIYKAHESGQSGGVLDTDILLLDYDIEGRDNHEISVC